MKIQVMVPSSNREFRKIKELQVKNYLPLQVSVDVICLDDGPANIEDFDDVIVAGKAIKKHINEGGALGYDGITIDCGLDPGFNWLNDNLKIPFTTAGFTSYKYAAELYDNFIVVVVSDEAAELATNNIQKYGFRNNVSSVVNANVTVDELVKNVESYNQLLVKVKEGIGNGGVGAVVLGCTGMSGFVTRLEKDLSVPVIDPTKMSLVRLMDVIK